MGRSKRKDFRIFDMESHRLVLNATDPSVEQLSSANPRQTSLLKIVVNEPIPLCAYNLHQNAGSDFTIFPEFFQALESPRALHRPENRVVVFLRLG